MRFLAVCLPLAVPLALASCAGDDGGGENVLPTASGGPTSGDGTGSDGASGSGVDASGSGGGVSIPAAYRFDCIDIQMIGVGDGDAFQAQFLEDVWRNDIALYRLNILFEVSLRDDMGGTASVGIRSGIGPDASNQCAEPSSATDAIDVGFDAASHLWDPSSEEEVCSAPAAAGAQGGGTYTMMLGPETVVYIYAEDDGGTTFNCTSDPGVVDAVPIRAVEAEITASAAEDRVAGTLLGCLLESEAEGLCSCTGPCDPEGNNHEDCGGCPTGSVPLRELLGDLATSDRCTGIMNAPAFDLQIGFSATALPGVPSTCG